MTRVKNLAAGPTELDQVWGLRSDFYKLFLEDYGRSLARLDPVLVELCRVRIAQLVESDFDLALRYKPASEAGLTEEKISALSDYPTSDLFSGRERNCLEFTEQFVIQSSSISDDDVARVQTVVSPEEFIYLCKALSVMDQFARANSAFRLAAPAEVPRTLPQFSIREKVSV
ncbi:carboxymuconolactone decarboxylase family protein [Streptomyces sp. QTS52]